MTMILLDTNIVSYQFKRDGRIAWYAPHLLGQELADDYQHLPNLTIITEK
jgi:hypothetical protein